MSFSFPSGEISKKNTVAASLSKDKSTAVPLLYTSAQFIEKITDRGVAFDFELRNSIVASLLTVGSGLNCSGIEERVMAHYNYWNDCLINETDTDKKYLAELGKILCHLELYNIPYINYLVFFYYFTQTEIKNLYRNYFIEWKQIEKSVTTENEIKWVCTPRDFNKLAENELLDKWMLFLKNVIVDNKSVLHIYFMINKLYQYITPFN